MPLAREEFARRAADVLKQMVFDSGIREKIHRGQFNDAVGQLIELERNITSLLQAIRTTAEGVGATVVRLDGHDLEPSPVRVLDALRESLAVPAGDGPIGGPNNGGRLVLLVDAYERMSPLDHWFRVRLVPRLPASAITVIASRDPPRPAWRTDPAWGALLRVVSLRNLGVMVSLLSAAGAVGALMSTTPFAWVVDQIGWRNAFFFLEGFTLLMAALVVAGVRDQPSGLPLTSAANGPVSVMIRPAGPDSS